MGLSTDMTSGTNVTSTSSQGTTYSVSWRWKLVSCYVLTEEQYKTLGLLRLTDKKSRRRIVALCVSYVTRGFVWVVIGIRQKGHKWMTEVLSNREGRGSLPSHPHIVISLISLPPSPLTSTSSLFLSLPLTPVQPTLTQPDTHDPTHPFLPPPPSLPLPSFPLPTQHIWSLITHFVMLGSVLSVLPF